MDLNPSLDHILRIREKLTAKRSHRSDQQRFEEIEMLLVFSSEVVLQELICGKLKGIGRHLSQHSRYNTMINSSYPFITIDMLQALS